MRRLIQFLTFVLLIAFIATASGYALWRQGVIQAWLMTKAENAIVKVYTEKIRDHLPVTVEKVEYQKTWSELLVGQINPVAITLRHGDLRIHLKGPLSFPAIDWSTFKQIYRKIRGNEPERTDQDLHLEYDPMVQFDSLRSSEKASLPSPLLMHLSVEISGELNELHEAKLELLPPRGEKSWRWPAAGIELQKPDLLLDWKSETDSPLSQPELKGKLEAASFAYKQNVSITQPRVNLELPLQIKPFALGPLLQIDWSAENGEALFGDRDFVASSEPLHGNAQLTLKDSTWSELKLSLGKTIGRQLHLKLVPETQAGHYQVQLDPLPLKEALPAFLKSTLNGGAPFNSLTSLQSMNFKEGTLALSLEGSIPLQGPQHGPGHLPDFSKLTEKGKIERADLRLSDASFLWSPHQLAVKNLNLKLPYVAGRGVEGEISISRLGYRKLKGHLKPTRISYEDRSLGKSTFRLGEKGSRIPLDFDDLLLRIDSISGTAQLSPFGFNLETRASLEPVPAEQLVRTLCMAKPETRIPPAKVQFSFPKIEISPAVTDLTGFVRADLFGGTIQLDEMGMYQFLSAVPEVDFNLSMNGIDLGELGNWANFGEMDGTLVGYAHDVVFQSWLPTQYDFEIKVQPKNHSDVVFSPEAMKNFSSLFSKEGIDHIPGYAKWLAFGLPSKLLGGYDIGYAGVHIHSEDGFIRLETLDPASDATSSGPDLNETHQKHFILYGRRFKIPLNSSRYPLILDGPAMGNYVHQMFGVIQSLSKKKKGEPQDEEDQNPEEPLPAACIPSDLSHL
jgi:hypothetical protein